MASKINTYYNDPFSLYSTLINNEINTRKKNKLILDFIKYFNIINRKNDMKKLCYFTDLFLNNEKTLINISLNYSRNNEECIIEFNENLLYEDDVSCFYSTDDSKKINKNLIFCLENVNDDCYYSIRNTLNRFLNIHIITKEIVYCEKKYYICTDNLLGRSKNKHLPGWDSFSIKHKDKHYEYYKYLEIDEKKQFIDKYLNELTNLLLSY
jgi:hypothetical protein